MKFVCVTLPLTLRSQRFNVKLSTVKSHVYSVVMFSISTFKTTLRFSSVPLGCDYSELRSKDLIEMQILTDISYYLKAFGLFSV